MTIRPNLNYSIINSSTDSDGYFQIKGKNPTDHQYMFLTLSLTIKPRIVTTKEWRIGKPEQWKEYNSHFNGSTRNKKPTNATANKANNTVPAQSNRKQDAREAMRVVFSVLTKRICMHKTKFLMNIFKYCLKIILNSMNLQIATQLIIMFNF